MPARASTPRSTSRSILWRSAVVSTSAAFVVAAFTAAACQSQGPTEPPPNNVIISGGGKGATGSGGSTTTGGTGNNTGTGGTGSPTGGVPATGGSGGTGTVVGGSGGSGAAPSSGGMSTGGSVSTGGVSTGGSVSTGGVSMGGMGGAPKPCVDTEPPPDPDWPDATCAKWAAETTECTASWFANYCDISCGRCTPSTGTGGTSSMGGMGGMGPKPCVDVEPPADPEWPGATCVDWASQTEECKADWFASYCDVSCGRCTPEGGGGSTGAPDCSKENLPNVTGGDGFATRYWDCCQTHCGQSDGHRCSKDGTTRTGDTNSACNGGGSYACYDEAPHAVSDCLSYGYIAKANPNCGGCYRIQFTGEGKDNANDPGSKLIKGKQMIVKVSNTGGDVASNQFDIMVPGGGVGKFNACSNQWGTSDLGAQYGGFFTACTGAYSAKKQCAHDACMKLPSGQMRDGCLWFTDWLQAADNPKFTSQQTNCPF